MAGRHCEIITTQATEVNSPVEQAPLAFNEVVTEVATHHSTEGIECMDFMTLDIWKIKNLLSP